MADSPAVSDLIKSITDDVKSLVRGEIALAKAELIPSAKNAGIGAGMFSVAAYLGISAATLLLIAAALGIAALGVPTPLAFVIVAVALLLIAGLLAAVGRGLLKKVKPPTAAKDQAIETVTEVKDAFQHAMAAAKAPEIEGRVVNGSRELR